MSQTDSTIEDKLKEERRRKVEQAFSQVLEHPFWAKLPGAICGGLEFLKGSEFNEVLMERIVRALGFVAEHGGFGEPEKAFLTAARSEFVGDKGGWATTIDFARALADLVDPDKKETPERLRDYLDLARFIYIAACEKPELLELLNDSVYKVPDPSVMNNPHLDALLSEFVTNGLLKNENENLIVKAMLSTLGRNWTADRCESSRRAFVALQHFREYDIAKMSECVTASRQKFPKVAQKILPIARALRVDYSENAVLRFEMICFTMHIACLGVHA